MSYIGKGLANRLDIGTVARDFSVLWPPPTRDYGMGSLHLHARMAGTL